MKLLVIGGTGYYGKSILECFVNNKLKIYGISRVIICARNIENFKDNFPELINNNVELVQLDISKDKQIPKANIVIHAATSTDWNDYINNGSTQKLNIERLASNFCDQFLDFHKEARVVYCSSGAVYGQQPSHVIAVKEDFKFQDVSSLVVHKRDYALGKREAEKHIIALGNKGIRVAIARCYASYGKYLPRNQHFAYGNFLGSAESGNTIEVNAKHEVIRSYIKADELVHSLIRIALKAETNCPIYNVGSDEAIELRDLAVKIGLEYGVGVNFQKLESDLIDRYVPDITKLKKLNSIY
jgi:nucleoside-diphosphate-sugar epimerase